MAEIVELQTFEQRRPRRRVLSGTADVVIFPGVRIERQNFSLADRLARPKRAVPKSHLLTQHSIKRED
jgi:hypothetical protein